MTPINLHPHEVRRLLDVGTALIVRPVKPQQPAKILHAEPWADGLWRIEHEPVPTGTGGHFVAVRAKPPIGPPGTVAWGRERWRICAWDFEDSVQTIEYADGQGMEQGYPHETDNDIERWTDWLIKEVDRYAARPDVHLDETIGDGGLYVFDDWSKIPWRSPVTMPRWASRFPHLAVGETRLLRVGELSEEDAEQTGVSAWWGTVHGTIWTPELKLWWTKQYGKRYPYPSAWVWAALVTRKDEE